MPGIGFAVGEISPVAEDRADRQIWPEAFIRRAFVEIARCADAETALYLQGVMRDRPSGSKVMKRVRRRTEPTPVALYAGCIAV